VLHARSAVARQPAVYTVSKWGAAGMSRRYLAGVTLVAGVALFSAAGAAWALPASARVSPEMAAAGQAKSAPLVSSRPKLAPGALHSSSRRVIEPMFPYKGSTAQALALAAAGETLPMWQHSESYPAGNPYSYTMVGSSPFVAGTGTTTITAPIIPIKFVLQTAGTTLSDASQVASDCGQTLSPVGLTQISPMFQNVVPDPEGNQTQWVDALQRGNFNLQTEPGGISPNYHLLLSATTPGGITITVPDADTLQQPGADCGTLSGVDLTWFFNNFPNIVSDLVTSGFISPTQFPLFVMYNTFLCNIADCNGGALGFHDLVQTTSGLQVFGVYDYDLTGSFSSTDTATMSHELAEAIDDPLANNPVPTWGYIGQDPSSCQQNLEPGDPLSAGFPGSPALASDTYTVGGTSYSFSLQDMAYHSWFYRESSPPTSKNIGNILGSGEYSLLGFFTGSSSSTVCPGQPTGVTATAGNGQAVVSWTAGPGPVDSYIVIPYLSGLPQNPQIFSSTATSQTVTGLTNGASYTFTVIAAHANSGAGSCPFDQQQLSAENGFDCSTESIPSNTVTPTGSLTPQSISFTPPSSGVVGGSATLSATGGGSGNPVVFSVDSSSGAGVCNVSGTHGTTVHYTAVGSCVIDANQAGNASYSPAPQVHGTINVGEATSTTAVSLSSSKVAYGHEKTLVVTVTVQPQFTGTPTGTVTVVAGTKTLCGGLTLSSGMATCSPVSGTVLPVGKYGITATYSGSTQFGSSNSTAKTLTVVKATSTTALSLSRSSVARGHEKRLVITVTVKPQFTGTPTGTVTVVAGTKTLCKSVTLSKGKATCSPSSGTVLPVGKYSVTARYSGSSQFDSSRSSAKTLRIT
jgi:hypothetical protein